MGVPHSVQWKILPPVCLLGHGKQDIGGSHTRHCKENAKDTEKRDSQGGDDNATIL